MHTPEHLQLHHIMYTTQGQIVTTVMVMLGVLAKEEVVLGLIMLDGNLVT